MEKSLEESNNKNQISPKSRLTALLLGILLGSLGIHNFYLGKILRGIAKIFLRFAGVIFFAFGYFENSTYSELFFYIGICLIFIPIFWALIEWILIACGKAKDSDDLIVIKW